MARRCPLCREPMVRSEPFGLWVHDGPCPEEPERDENGLTAADRRAIGRALRPFA